MCMLLEGCSLFCILRFSITNNSNPVMELPKIKSEIIEVLWDDFGVDLENIKKEKPEGELCTTGKINDFQTVDNIYQDYRTEIVKNECTDEFNIKVELEEYQDESIKDTSGEMGNYDYHLAYNCENQHAEGMEEADVTNLNEENSSIETTSNYCNSFGRQRLDLLQETPRDEEYFKGRPSASTHIDKNQCEITKCYLRNLESEFGNSQPVQELELPIYMNRHAKKSFECSVCKHKFARKSNLNRHMRIYTNEKPFKCSICDHKFMYNYHLLRHMRIHSKEKPFQCSVCEYKCAQKESLVSHMCIHTGEKPFKCSFCNYKSAYKSNLASHNVHVHSGEKQFECSGCDSKFLRKSNLVKHMHIPSDKKRYECSICDYSCVRESQLVMHIEMHTAKTRFECYNCKYLCNKKASLIAHMKAHINKKKFLKCNAKRS